MIQVQSTSREVIESAGTRTGGYPCGLRGLDWSLTLNYRTFSTLNHIEDQASSKSQPMAQEANT